MSKTVVVQPRQTLFDIAVQEYGSIASLAMLIEDNQKVLDNITSIPAGTGLSIRTPLPAINTINKQVVSYFQNNIKPATWTE